MKDLGTLRLANRLSNTYKFKYKLIKLLQLMPAPLLLLQRKFYKIFLWIFSAGTSCLWFIAFCFRIALLTICIICILLTFMMIGCVYNHRKLKIIKVSSPIFLYITLVGAIIMYSEVSDMHFVSWFILAALLTLS